MWAEFKEKTYETAFVGELRLLTNIIYAPDQTDENLLGFDVSAFLPWEMLPPFLPHMRYRRWKHFIGVSAAEINDLGAEMNSRLPKFRLNLFIQFKRPQYLVGKNASEWKEWNQAYYRYKLESHQQKLLHKINLTSKGRAKAFYAVPAFHLSDDLFNKTLDETIIKSSNIVDASLLEGHSKCTFAEAGNIAMAHSQPTEIRGPVIEELISPNETAPEFSFTRNLKETSNLIKTALEEDIASLNTLELGRRAILGGPMSEVYPRAAGSWYDALITILAFSNGFGVKVCCSG